MLGAYRLGDYTKDTIEIECPKCSRRGRFHTANVRAEYGDGITMPDLLGKLVTKCAGKSLNFPCQARYCQNSIIRSQKLNDQP